MTAKFLFFLCVCFGAEVRLVQPTNYCEINSETVSAAVGFNVTEEDFFGVDYYSNVVELDEEGLKDYGATYEDAWSVKVKNCKICKCDEAKLICKNTDQCVHGNWSEWSPWSACPEPCGIGTRSRQRKCDNPPPKGGGNKCEGKTEEEENCKCPIVRPIQQQAWESLGRTEDQSDFLPNARMNMTCSVILASLSNYDETSASLTIGYKLHMTWKDPTLVWKLEKFNVTKILLPSSKLWIPDIVPDSSIEHEIDSNAEVSFDGEVKMIRYCSTIITCNRVKINPEQQECKVTLRSWSYDGLQLNIQLTEGNSDNLNIKDAIFDGLEASGWTYVQGSVQLNVNRYPFPVVIVSVIIEKRD